MGRKMNRSEGLKLGHQCLTQAIAVADDLGELLLAAHIQGAIDVLEEVMLIHQPVSRAAKTAPMTLRSRRARRAIP